MKPTDTQKKRRAGWGRGQGARKKLLRQTRTYRSGFASRYICARFHTRSPRRRRSAASSYVHTLEDLASRSSSSQPFRISFILRTKNPPLERCFPLPLPLVCVRARCSDQIDARPQPRPPVSPHSSSGRAAQERREIYASVDAYSVHALLFDAAVCVHRVHISSQD